MGKKLVKVLKSCRERQQMEQSGPKSEFGVKPGPLELKGKTIDVVGCAAGSAWERSDAKRKRKKSNRKKGAYVLRHRRHSTPKRLLCTTTFMQKRLA